jgi:hypothetical protein
MAKRFTCRHLKNGYAAMGGSRKRPYYPAAKGRTVAESIAKNRETAARMARAQGSKRK